METCTINLNCDIYIVYSSIIITDWSCNFNVIDKSDLIAITSCCIRVQHYKYWFRKSVDYTSSFLCVLNREYSFTWSHAYYVISWFLRLFLNNFSPVITLFVWLLLYYFPIIISFFNSIPRITNNLFNIYKEARTNKFLNIEFQSIIIFLNIIDTWNIFQ